MTDPTATHQPGHTEDHERTPVMGIFKGKAPAPPTGKSSNAEKPECDRNGWCFGCGGVGYLGSSFGGKITKTTCRDCGGTGKA